MPVQVDSTTCCVPVIVVFETPQSGKSEYRPFAIVGHRNLKVEGASTATNGFWAYGLHRTAVTELEPTGIVIEHVASAARNERGCLSADCCGMGTTPESWWPPANVLLYAGLLAKAWVRAFRSAGETELREGVSRSVTESFGRIGRRFERFSLGAGAAARLLALRA